MWEKSRGTLISMDKQDMMYLAAGLILVLVIALVIKPMVTGHPVDTGISVATTTPLPVAVADQQIVSPEPHIVLTSTSFIPTPTPTPIPSPVPTWNPKVTQTVAFVNPSTYGVSFNQSIPAGTRINSVPYDTNMTTFATIASNNGSSGTTGIMYVPFPYWELWYTVDPAGPAGGKGQSFSSSTVTVGPTSGMKGSGSSQTVIQGSFSVTNPQFTINVMDGNDPNRIVRTITPPGGLDSSLWVTTTDADGNIISTDPRPWIEKFFEGQRNYYFIITTHSLSSYSIQIRVPTRYIGKY
jgi:hypothetical protein